MFFVFHWCSFSCGSFMRYFSFYGDISFLGTIICRSVSCLLFHVLGDGRLPHLNGGGLSEWEGKGGGPWICDNSDSISCVFGFRY